MIEHILDLENDVVSLFFQIYRIEKKCQRITQLIL